MKVVVFLVLLAGWVVAAPADVAVPADEKPDLARELREGGMEVQAGDFKGFTKLSFQVEPGVTAFVVHPRKACEGRPWIWRARFFGHQPALDLELLERGWHLAYCDVSNLYGGPEAMRRWGMFHSLMQRCGLSGKPVMEGMSRGGLPVFRWASLHPDKVAAVYGDNPVCDFRSWPGGVGGKRSDGDWQRLLKAWSITDEEARKHDQVVDWLEPMAKARVPVALVLGMADDVVPPARNGEVVAARYKELGAPVKVWRKQGQGHHPHGLHPPGELRDWLLKAAGQGG